MRLPVCLLPLCAGLFGLSTSIALAQPAPPPKRVLALYWYGRHDVANSAIEPALRAALRSDGSLRVEYFSENLESDRFPGAQQEEFLRDYLQQKYSKLAIDVVVAIGTAPRDFLLRNRQTLFTDAPLVFMGGPRATTVAATDPGITGIVLYRNVRKQLDLILRLHPRTDRVFVISGSLERDGRYEAAARAELQQPPVPVTYLTDLPLEELAVRVKGLHPGSVILYTWQQARNDFGNVMEPADVLAAISPVASVPIYAMSELVIGRGSVGGDVTTFETNGRRVGEIAMQILHGTLARDIPPAPAPTTLMFDWRQIRRWGIDESQIPAGSVIRFREPSVWDRYRWYILGAVALSAIQGALIVALLIQRASRKRAELMAHEQQRELTHLSRVATVGELAGTLAHEMGQPLAAILINAQVAKKLLTHDSFDRNELKAALDDIVRDDQRAAEVIKRIWSALRKRDVVREEINLNDVVNDTLTMSASTLMTRSISVTTALMPDLPSVRGDRIELQQVLLNLILNASDAMNALPSTKRVLTVRTEATPDNGVQVSVTDQGMGVPAGMTEVIFTPFFTTKQQGLGLGLAICRSIISAHQGLIAVESGGDSGATISFRLPRSSPVQRLPSATRERVAVMH